MARSSWLAATLSLERMAKKDILISFHENPEKARSPQYKKGFTTGLKESSSLKASIYELNHPGPLQLLDLLAGEAQAAGQDLGGMLPQ